MLSLENEYSVENKTEVLWIFNHSGSHTVLRRTPGFGEAFREVPRMNSAKFLVEREISVIMGLWKVWNFCEGKFLEDVKQQYGGLANKAYI
jgi:hypothetical protein